MPLERGTYGIEYDGSQRGSGGRLWLLALLIPLALIVFFVRGCRDDGGRVYEGDDAVVTDEQNLPEVSVRRERPSLAAHFFDVWKRKIRGESLSENKTSAGLDAENPDAGEGTGLAGQPPQAIESVAGVSDEVGRLIGRSDQLRDTGDLVSARMILEKLRLRPEAQSVRSLIEKRIGEININLILSDKAMPGKIQHKVASGDLISRLCRRYGNTQEYIMRVNAIDRPERVRIGRDLWLLDNPIFELMIDKSEHKAVLLFNHRFFKNYSVGIGSAESVPGGSFTVSTRSIYRDARGEERHGISLQAAAGAPEAGGFRMHAAESLSAIGRTTGVEGIVFTPAEAEELYILLPAGSTVTIID